MKSLPKAYEPQKYEDKIYKAWEKSGYFNPDNLKLPKDAKPYTIVLPPPNITDKLHLGHGSIIAIEDLLVRFHRMKGFRALYLPGTDHAAIATQNVVEKKLLKEKKITRHDLGKEKFLDEVWKFLRETQSTILKQARKMGGSFDWSREAFTLDEERKKAVKQMFVAMYNEGVIYRGERIVNWCPRCHSTLADDELEYEEQKGKLYTFKYSKDFPISIATTRPETKLGDTAVAVNPKDKRYQKYIGKTFKVDFIGIPLSIKIIADRQVDMEFGTGALGVTPAHSMVDWKMAEENKLPTIKVIDEDGKIHDSFGEFSRKTAAEARQMVVSELEKKGLIEKQEEIVNNLSVCYRCGTPIEPLPSKQWFVSVDKKLKKLGNKSLKEKAIEVAKKNKIKFIPFRFTKRYLDWMNNLHDWCISRQIWFGHDIPVWYKKGETYVGTIPPKGKGWAQDPDTLDTWFSSGMWTFSTLGWPDTYKNGKETGDLAKFHPTQVLETGYEIITLWVSRMIMMSLFALNEIPFEKVYLHGMVLDKFGKKMSKSKGNGIDPLEMIEKFGTDAVRLSLLIGSTPGNDMRLSEEKIEGMRNFINKFWNISRYIIESIPEGKGLSPHNGDLAPKNLSLSDKWIVGKLENLVGEVTRDLNNFNFSMAGEKLRDFTWNDFADWYIEISKVEKNKDAVLLYILDKLLRLWHPFIPFVTEEIYQTLNDSKNNNFLMIETWPEKKKEFKISKNLTKDFEKIQGIISSLRHLRAIYRIDLAKTIPVMILASDAKAKKLIESNAEIIGRLAKVEIRSVEKNIKRPDKSALLIYENLKIFAILEHIIDFNNEKERLSKELKTAESYLENLSRKLSNKEFVKKAPKEIVQIEKEKMEKQKYQIIELKQYLKNLG